MTTMPSGPVTRVVFAAQQRGPSVRSVHVRQSTADDEQYDSDSEMSQRRTMRRGKRTADQRASSFAARHLWRRQNMRPAVEPKDEDEEDEEEESSESSDSSDSSSSSSSSDSSDSSPEDAEKDDSDSDADSIESGSDSESDKEEDDKKKEAEKKKEKEKEKETQKQPAPSSGLPSSAPSAPGFQTLVPGAPPPEEQPRRSSSAQAPPAQTQAPSSLSAKPTLATTTRPAEPTTQPQPAETLINEGPIPDSDATTSLLDVASTTTNAERLSTATGEPATGDQASASQISDSSSGSPRGTEVGIVIGTLAIAALLIAAGIFFFRKRRQSNKDHLERLPDEKSLPPDPPTFKLSAPPAAARAPRTQSSIMDEAIGAAYQNEANQTYAQPNLSQDFIPVAYDQNPRGNMASAAAAAPVSPISPRTSHLSPEWQPVSPGGQQPTQPPLPMANFQLFPPPNPPPMVPPPPVKFSQAQGPFVGAAPPGSFAYNQGQRNSFAQTETTEGEGTWSTFAVERMRANDGKLPLKERMFGHF